MTDRSDITIPLRSIDEGYIPVDTDILFNSLVNITNLFDELGIGYVLTGGTLLGAVREGDLINGDTDWDLEIIDDDLEVLFASQDRLLEIGLKLTFPHLQDVFALSDPKDIKMDCNRRIVKIYDADGNFHGDLFVHTLFTDGLLRRVNLEKGAYINAKMTYPVWFFENRELIEIRDQKFYAPAEPEMMVERIYGPHWRTPLARHQGKPGFNFAGAIANANIEKGIKHALSQGWIPFYPDAKPWPMDITHTNSEVSAKWIKRHEHLDLSKYIVESDSFKTTEEVNSSLVLAYRAQISSLRTSYYRATAQLDVLVALVGQGEMTVSELTKCLEKSPSIISRACKTLVRKGKLIRLGNGAYSLPLSEDCHEPSMT